MSAPIHAMKMGPQEWGLLLVLSLIWGGSFLFGRIAVAELPPLTVALFRVFIGAATLFAVVLAMGSLKAMPANLAGWQPFAIMGLLNNAVPFSLILWGQQELGAGIASILNATTPLFAAVIAHLFTTDEKLTWAKTLGILTGIAGVAVLAGPAVWGTVAGAATPGVLLAGLAVLGGAASYGLAGLQGRRLRGTPPLVSATCQLTCSTVILAVAASLVDRPWTLPLPSLQAASAVLGLALLCTAVAYVLFFTIIQRAGSTNAMLVTLLIPPSAILLGALFLNETLTGQQAAGAALIGLALLVIDGRLSGLGRLRTRPPR